MMLAVRGSLARSYCTHPHACDSCRRYGPMGTKPLSRRIARRRELRAWTADVRHELAAA